MTAVIGVVVLLGGLIFFHELGHYAVAKLFGVKVEVFSLGFGKKLFRWKFGETEYCLSLIPFGGYVKLMGDDPYKGVPAAEAERAFSTQKIYKRFLIVAAGPLANLLLAYILFMIIFFSGKPMLAPRVGAVGVGSPTWEAGLRALDKIVSIDGQPVTTWNDLEEAVTGRVGQTVNLQVDRAGQVQQVSVPVTSVPSRNAYGEEVTEGGLEGVSPGALAAVIGVSNPESAAAKAGLQTGDQIIKVDSQPIEFFAQLNGALAGLLQEKKPLVVTVKRPAPDDKEKSVEHSFTLAYTGPEKTEHPFGLVTLLGIYPSEVFVKEVTADSPASKGGLLPGDRVVSINNEPVYQFESVVEKVQSLGKRNEPMELGLERAGTAQVLTLKPAETTETDQVTREPVSKFRIGFMHHGVYAEPETVAIKVRNPVELVKRAVAETNLLAERMVVSLYKLVIGQISVKNLGGPVLIASVAGKSLELGIIPFLQMMALISTNLFLLNLFPIPILDGGHLLFFMIEAIKGKPVSVRTMEVANQIGMVFILMLIGLTLYNDISQHVFKN